MSTHYLPIVGNAADGPQAVTMSLTARDALWREQFIALWLVWPGNLRTHMQRNAKLMQAAQAFAEEMHVTQDALGVIPGFPHIGQDGSTPNERARRAGYRLHDGYLPKGNQIESVGANWEGPEKMMKRFLLSPTHTEHLLGLHEWFREQTQFGVGVSGDYFDILTAHPEEE